MSAPTLMVGATLAGSDRDVWTGEVGSLNGLSASARSASAGARRIDRGDRVERDHWRHRASASANGKVATLTVSLSHDVSAVLGIGRQRGSQPRANTSTTIMRAPQRGHGQGINWLPASRLLPRAAGWSAATLCLGTEEPIDVTQGVVGLLGCS